MFSFRYDGEERLFCVADEMNEGVVKLFRRDAVVEDGGHNTLAAFRVWMVARVSNLGEGEDDDVAHYDWCMCVYKDHGYLWCCYWVRKYFFFQICDAH